MSETVLDRYLEMTRWSMASGAASSTLPKPPSQGFCRMAGNRSRMRPCREDLQEVQYYNLQHLITREIKRWLRTSITPSKTPLWITATNLETLSKLRCKSKLRSISHPAPDPFLLIKDKTLAIEMGLVGSQGKLRANLQTRVMVKLLD